VQYLTLGDTIAWQAYPMGHRVHLKPRRTAWVTNLTVVTDRRCTTCADRDHAEEQPARRDLPAALHLSARRGDRRQSGRRPHSPSASKPKRTRRRG